MPEAYSSCFSYNDRDSQNRPAVAALRLEQTAFADIMARTRPMGTDPESSVELLERARAGNSDALDRL